MATGVNDKYANMAAVSMTLSAGALQFVELQTGISLGQGMGILIDEIDYYIETGAKEDMGANGDSIIMAWTASNSISDIPISDKSVIHQHQCQYFEQGTPANFAYVTEPSVYQFLPPMIVAAPRIYLAAKSNAAVTGYLRSRLMYRFIKLTSQEYLEIAESFVLVG